MSAASKKKPGESLHRIALRRLRRRPSALVAAFALGAISWLALATPLLPVDSPDRQQTRLGYTGPDLGDDGALFLRGWNPNPRIVDDLLPWDRGLVELRSALFGDRYLSPVLGRDSLGRCLLARILWGARVSLLVGIAAGLVSVVIGVAYGAVSGLLGGRVDNLLMRLVDVFYSIPFIFIVIFLITMLRAGDDGSGKPGGSNLTVFLVVIGLVYWLTMARVVRGQVISLREQEFIEAARSLGASNAGILWRHVFPNIASVVIVTLTLTIPRVMLFEAFLSFLGLGVEAPDVSWGLLVREAFDVLNPVQIVWWMVLWPSVFLAATLAALNHFGDCLRDALDPRTVG